MAASTKNYSSKKFFLRDIAYLLTCMCKVFIAIMFVTVKKKKIRDNLKCPLSGVLFNKLWCYLLVVQHQATVEEWELYYTCADRTRRVGLERSYEPYCKTIHVWLHVDKTCVCTHLFISSISKRQEEALSC